LFPPLFLFLVFFFFFFRDVGTGCMMTTELGFDSAECALDERKRSLNGLKVSPEERDSVGDKRVMVLARIKLIADKRVMSCSGLIFCLSSTSLH
jgi:hypothetical protein